MKMNEETREEIFERLTKSIETLASVVDVLLVGLQTGRLYKEGSNKFTEAANDVRFAYEDLCEKVGDEDGDEGRVVH